MDKKLATGCGSLIGMAIVSLFLVPFIELWLWNDVLVDIFPQIPVIDNYWTMFGINWLCHLLFKGTNLSVSSD